VTNERRITAASSAKRWLRKASLSCLRTRSRCTCHHSRCHCRELTTTPSTTHTYTQTRHHWILCVTDTNTQKDLLHKNKDVW